jgi:hypothetical protein
MSGHAKDVASTHAVADTSEGSPISRSGIRIEELQERRGIVNHH